MGESRNTHGAMRNAYAILVRSPIGQKRSGGPKRSWEDDIKVYNEGLE
jgi:hypothetical protein